MKIPFLNRQRYIVLKCYTWSELVHQYAPIQLATKDPVPKRNSKPDNNVNFLRCYAHTKGKKRSATILSPATFKINVKDGGVETEWSSRNEWCGIDHSHMNDPFYGTPNTHLLKICTPWCIEEKTGVNFVMGRHIQNKTPMQIPCGMLQYKHGFGANIFMHVGKHDHSYEIPFREPLVSIFPMSELPLHVESYFDRRRFMELVDRSNELPFFTNYRVKLEKLDRVGRAL